LTEINALISLCRIDEECDARRLAVPVWSIGIAENPVQCQNAVRC
jgi:hypothetical protein